MSVRDMAPFALRAEFTGLASGTILRYYIILVKFGQEGNDGALPMTEEVHYFFTIKSRV